MSALAADHLAAGRLRRARCDSSGAELLRRIEPAGSPALYESRIGDNHHHLVCTACGRVADVECVVGERAMPHAGDTNGFVLHTAEVTFWGLCPDLSAGGLASVRRRQVG